MEEAPGHGPDIVEEMDGVLGARGVDGAGTDEETQVNVDLFGRPVGDAVVVEPVASGSPGAFGEIRRNGRCGSDHLVGDRFEWSGNPHHERNRDAGRCYRFVEGIEAG